MDWSRAGLTEAGFTGWVPFADLPAHRPPAETGVYLVYRPGTELPQYVDPSPAGWFHGRDPSVSESVLAGKWVTGAGVVYIGKAGGSRGLNGRLSAYRRHGEGRRAAHWGGRYVWQLADAAQLLVAWKTADNVGALEHQLIAQFIADHGQRPFANLNDGSPGV